MTKTSERLKLLVLQMRNKVDVMKMQPSIVALSIVWDNFLEHPEMYIHRIVWLMEHEGAGTNSEQRIFDSIRKMWKHCKSREVTQQHIHAYLVLFLVAQRLNDYTVAQEYIVAPFASAIRSMRIYNNFYDLKIELINKIELMYEQLSQSEKEAEAHLLQHVIKSQQKQSPRNREMQEATLRRLDSLDAMQVSIIRHLDRLEATQTFQKLCHDDFLTVDQVFREQSILNQADLALIKTTFLRDWFEAHLPTGYTQPDDDQLNAIGSVHGNVQVVARAGSGKTSTLVNRVFFLMKHCRVQANEIMMLAFNRKAANEMRERLLRLLYPKVASEYDTIKADRRATMHRKDIDDVQISLDALTQLRTKHDVGLPFVMTFHGLVHNIANPSETIIYDTGDPEVAIQSNALQKIIDKHIRVQDKVGVYIKQLMLHYFRSEWIDIEENNYGLTQAEFLAYRRSILKMSLQGYPVKSYGEKIIADFLFSHDVKYEYEQDVVIGETRYRPDFTLWKDKKRIIIEYIGLKGDADYDELVAQKKEEYKKLKCQYIEITPADVSDETQFRRYMVTLLKSLSITYRALDDDEIWERIKDRAIGGFSRSMNGFIQKCRQLLLLPTDLEQRIRTHKPLHADNYEIEFATVARRLYQEYLEKCDADHLIDFSAIMQRATQMIREGQSDFSKRHSHGSIRQIRFLSIDEFQDFSVMFYELLSAMRGLNPTMQLFCVGDDWQAINRFAGADTRYFSEFERYIGPRTLCAITTNYRSAKRIVDMGNALMHERGVPAKAAQMHVGEIVLVYIDDFVGTEKESEHFGRYGYDIAALSRLVNLHVRQQRNVAVLSRTTAPLEDAFPKISKLFERANTKLVRSTTHGYKGLEQESVILWDVTERQYPMLHPHWIFGRILGDTLEQIIEDERRLFYVGVTRARETLYIVTRRQSMSPFLRALLKTCTVSELSPNNLQVIESLRSGALLVRLNGKTFDIKEYIKQCGYKWSSTHKVWEQRVNSDEFSERWLASQAWFAHATSITVTCVDENDDTVLDMYEVESGRIHKVKS